MRFTAVTLMAGSAVANYYNPYDNGNNGDDSSNKGINTGFYNPYDNGVSTAHGASTATDYSTQLVTVTDCPPSVTNCPAHSKTSSVITSLVPMTTSTVYSTNVYTVTSCAPTVTNCPAHSVVVSTEVIAVSTTVCPIAAHSSAPSYYSNSTATHNGQCGGHPCPPFTGAPVPTGPATKNTAAPMPTEAPICKVKPVTKTYTTVEYVTEEGCAETKAAPIATGAAAPVYTAPAGGNKTAPVSPVTAGAGSFAGSVVFAAAAGVAAYVFA